MSDPVKRATGGSQTLARGLAALALIGESQQPPTVADLAEHLGIHQSMVYRLVRTLEDFGFVTRNSAGQLEVGVRLANIARNVARDLQQAAIPELTTLANQLGMTAFIVTYDGEQAVTLFTVEPQSADITIAQRPGSRHPIEQGAPGRVIRSLVFPQEHPPQEYETSHDEVFAGLSSVGVPLKTPDRRPTSLAVLYRTAEVDTHNIAAQLLLAARRIELALGTH